VTATELATSSGWTPEALARGAVAQVDLDAFRANVARCAEAAPGAGLLAVVKADAYGHGLVPCARAALEAGATWLGTALVDEAITLRDAGVGGRILTWLAVPGARFVACLERDIDVTVSAHWTLDEVAAAARAHGRTARVQLKADTGLSRNGATPDDWPSIVAAAAALEREGVVRVTGVWSHFANADRPGHESVARQLAAFDEALDVVERAGLRPEVRHLANSAGVFGTPRAHLDLVRAGIGMYGLSPGPAVGSARDLGLRPVMTLRARLAAVKRVPAGEAVSYGSTYSTERETSLGLVPLGYADGIPRAASNAGPVLAAGRVRTVAGRVCMDQIVVDLGDDPASPGDEVVVFGTGGPSADDWGDACGTIGYEIVTRIGPRVPRVHTGVRP
jgi:alanine racemase